MVSLLHEGIPVYFKRGSMKYLTIAITMAVISLMALSVGSDGSTERSKTHVVSINKTSERSKRVIENVGTKEAVGIKSEPEELDPGIKIEPWKKDFIEKSSSKVGKTMLLNFIRDSANGVRVDIPYDYVEHNADLDLEDLNRIEGISFRGLRGLESLNQELFDSLKHLKSLKRVGFFGPRDLSLKEYKFPKWSALANMPLVEDMYFFNVPLRRKDLHRIQEARPNLKQISIANLTTQPGTGRFMLKNPNEMVGSLNCFDELEFINLYRHSGYTFKNIKWLGETPRADRKATATMWVSHEFYNSLKPEELAHMKKRFGSFRPHK